MNSFDRITKKIKENGYESDSDFCTKNNLGAAQFYDFCLTKITPDGIYTNEVNEIFDLLSSTPEYLFQPDTSYSAIQSNLNDVADRFFKKFK